MEVQSEPTKRKRRHGAQLRPIDQQQMGLFGLSEASEGVIRIPASIVGRLGWKVGEKVYLSTLDDIPPTNGRPGLLVEVK